MTAAIDNGAPGGRLPALCIKINEPFNTSEQNESSRDISLEEQACKARHKPSFITFKNKCLRIDN
jgi:hypothetical protein